MDSEILVQMPSLFIILLVLTLMFLVLMLQMMRLVAVLTLMLQDRRRMDMLARYVRAAEQLYGPDGHGVIKRKYVQEMALQSGFEDNRTLLEAAVYDLRREIETG